MAGPGAALLLAVSLVPAGAAGLVGARSAARAYTAGPTATGASVERTANAARLIFDINMPVVAHAYVLADPARVIIDLPEIGFFLDPAIGRPARATRGRPEEAGLVSSFRFGQLAPGRSRIVIDLAGPARIVRAESESTSADGAARFVIELASIDADSFRAAARAARAAQIQASVARPAPQPPAAPGLPLVYLDPGHGGVDAGAVGAGGVDEKTIVLDFARQLAAKLEQDGKVRAMLTRSDDTFIPLAQRVKIAREGGASLFMSIHADTLNETSVHGATVYTLSDRASDAEAARLAAKENAADRAGGLADSEDAVDVNDILFDLARRETRAMSHRFAQSLASEWKSAGDLNKNPVRSAGFVVLKAPDVPSALLELGYLSSDKDLAKLASPAWREEAAAKVAAAIERYFMERPRAADDRTASVGSFATQGAAIAR